MVYVCVCVCMYVSGGVQMLYDCTAVRLCCSMHYVAGYIEQRMQLGALLATHFFTYKHTDLIVSKWNDKTVARHEQKKEYV